MFEKGQIDITKFGGSGAKSAGLGQSVVTSVSIVSDQLVIDGANLDGVTNVRITGPSGFDQTFAIESQSDSNLVANGLSNIAFAVGSVFDLILTDAQGAATHQVTFTLQDGAVTASKLDDMGAGVGQVLRYDGSTWGPGDLGALSYAGNWDASSATAPNVSPAAGEFYIVSVAGSTDLSGGTGTNSWAVGDWAVWNNVASQWEKVANGSSVTSFNGRSGPVTPATNDYTWAQIDKTSSPIGDLSNVDTTGAGVGSVLKFDGTNWIVGTDNTAAAGSVDSTAITDGSIVDADVNAAANIAQSKINNLTTDLAAKLNLSGGTMTGDLTVPNLITSGNVDGVDVSALNTTVGNNTTAIAGKQNTITTGSTAQYLRGDLSLSTFATDARSAAVLNFTAGSETDRAASVASMKTYVASQISGSGSILNGGNTTGATVVVGTNDAQSLQLETNNTPAVTILNGGNVGIGTTNPATLLSLQDTTSGANEGIRITTANNVLGFIDFADPEDTNTGAISYNHSTNTMSFRTNDVTDRMVINSSGNVGIGTTSPHDGRLVVHNTNTDEAYIAMDPGSAANNDIMGFRVTESGNNTTKLHIGREFTGDSNFQDYVTVESSGNVGVGTASPTAKLEVVGQTRSVNSSGAAQVNGTAAVDWNNGNAQSMSAACTSTTFSNMLNGGTYVLAVSETGTTTCTFSQAGLTFYFSPANGARTSGQRTVYTFQRIGNDVYVSWIKGFQ